MKKETNKKSGKMSKGKKMAMAGAITAGAAAVGAGAYMLMGPDGKKNQKKLKALMTKIEKEAKAEFKKAKSMTMPIYNQVVDKVAETYADQYEAHEGDIKALAKKLKGEWKSIEKEAAKKVSKTAKKTKSSK